MTPENALPSRLCGIPMGLVGVLLLLPVAVWGAPDRDCSAPPAPVDLDMDIRQVSPHVYYAPGQAGIPTENKGFISNASFVVTDAGVVVFDALGTPSLAARLVEEIRQVTRQPITTVVVSHYHADHIYGLQVFQDLGATIIGPAAARDYIASPQAAERLEERRMSLAPWVNDCTRLVAPHRVVEDELRFAMGEVEFQVTYLGSAHSDGDLAMYVRPDRVLLSGDIIFEGRVPFVGDAHTGHWLAVLERMEITGVEALIPGHGPAAREPNEAIRATRRYLEHLRATMGAAVADFVPFSEAYEAADWSGFDHLPAFEAANRRNAYQVYLSLEAESLE